MNRHLIYLILLLFAFSCSRNIRTTSVQPNNGTASSIKTPPPGPKKEAKTIPSKRPAANKATPPAKVLTTYQSIGNDMADIVVKLLGNKKFSFQMTIKPKEDGKKEDRILMGGTWKYENNRTILLFDRKDVDLNALFDKNYASGEEFEILDPHRVAISTSLGVIHIWGVACEKK